jgi:Uncharacterized protein conserved in bacteria
MTGDYDSVLGMEKDEPVNRFLRKIPTARFQPALGEPTLCGVAVEVSDSTGLAEAIGRFASAAACRGPADVLVRAPAGFKANKRL